MSYLSESRLLVNKLILIAHNAKAFGILLYSIYSGPSKMASGADCEQNETYVHTG